MQPIVAGSLESANSSILAARRLFKYQGVKEFHMLARIGCCNFMVFSPFKVNVTYYIGGSKGGREGCVPPPGGPNSFNFMQFFGKFGNFVCWCPLLGEILDPPLYYHPLNQWLLGATNGNQGQTVMDI